MRTCARVRWLCFGVVLAGVAPAQAQDEALAPVADLVRRGDDEGALRSFDALPEAARTTPRGRYLRGRILERLGRPGDAADALALPAPPGVPGVIADDARRRRVRLLARAGRCADVGDD